MKRFCKHHCCAVLVLLAITGELHAAGEVLSERLRVRVEQELMPGELEISGDHVRAESALQRFYMRRGFQVAWSKSGSPSGALKQLIEAIDATAVHGLNPADYHLDVLQRLDLPVLDAGQAIDLELFATDAYLLMASHFLTGRLDPESLDADWYAGRRELDLVIHLEQALANDNLDESLTALLPQQQGYHRLVQQLAVYRSRDDWSPVPADTKLESGSTGPAVVALQARLIAMGLLEETGITSGVFDNAVAEATRAFQRQHGLEDDGVVGKATLAALNATRQDYIHQILVNLERWRWLPNELGRRHIRVNIADYRLEAWGDGERQLDMKVIVGRDYRRTPVFSEGMRYLVFNPRWVVPSSIAVKDKLPELRADPAAVVAKGFEVYQGWGAEQRTIDPTSVNWNAVSSKGFPYRLVQKPGPRNALGQIKFMLPNKFDVYLHDTPDRQLFERNDRNFSSGCIRLHRPLELAEWVLRETSGWRRQDIDTALAARLERSVQLAAVVPVHIQYWTAWGDEHGTLQLRRDLYGRDKAVLSALREAMP